MAVNETIVTGRKFRKLIDAANKQWQRISFWHKASDCEFDDGDTAETKVGAIKGITTDLNTTTTGYAADMTTVASLNSSLKSFQTGVDTLYNKCVSLGSTPTAKTPSAIANAMDSIGGGYSLSGLYFEASRPGDSKMDKAYGSGAVHHFTMNVSKYNSVRFTNAKATVSYAGYDGTVYLKAEGTTIVSRNNSSSGTSTTSTYTLDVSSVSTLYIEAQTPAYRYGTDRAQTSVSVDLIEVF